MFKYELEKTIENLREEIEELKTKLPLNEYLVKTSEAEEITIKAHGFNDDSNPIRFWVHPDWTTTAIVDNPIYVKKL